LKKKPIIQRLLVSRKKAARKFKTATQTSKKGECRKSKVVGRVPALLGGRCGCYWEKRATFQKHHRGGGFGGGTDSVKGPFKTPLI